MRGAVTVRDGSITVPNGDVIAAAVSLVDHTHVGVQPGSGTSGPPLAQASPGNNSEALEDAFNDAVDSLAGLEGNDELLLCLPEIAEAEATRCTFSNDAEGWRYLKSMFHKWFSGPANEKAEANKEPFWVDWNWIMSYSEAKQNYAILKDVSYLFNEKAEKALVAVLEEDKLLTDEVKAFDYISPDWTTWKHGYFQYVSVEPAYSLTLDGLVAAMGAFVLQALAKGYVEPLPQGGHRIHVEEVAVYVRDSFSFGGTQLLGFWSCEGKDFALLPSGEVEYRVVSNEDFKAFRRRTGHGSDFLVLSQPHSIEDFGGHDYDTSR